MSFKAPSWFRGLVLSASLVLIGGAGSWARADQDQTQTTTVLSEWSRDLWQFARQGESSRAIDLLEALPVQAEPLPAEASGVEGLAMAVERFKGNIARREESRAARIEEVRAELEKHADAGEQLKALKDAIEWHTLATEKTEVIHHPTVSALVENAIRDAKAAEEAGKWLDAHALYNHLNVLFEDQRTYEQDLRRLSQRLIMLRLYTPEKLYEMRNAQRIAEGEDPLPPYNKIGEDWHEKLREVDDRILRSALSQAATQHVDRVSWDKMLAGGYRALRTMVSTPDLADAFPELASEAARRTMLEHLDARIAHILENPTKVDYQEMAVGLRQLFEVNAQTTKIAREAIIHEFANGAFAELDEFSAIIWPDELAQFERTTEGTFKGVGVQITLNDALEIKVVTPLEGTPAARAGIRSGDIIRKVDGDATLGMALNQAVERITGPAGSKVTLTIEREGADEPIEFILTRQEIPIYSVKGWLRNGPKETDWDWFIDRPNQVGYVRISQFNNKTTQELRAALSSMRAQGLKGLIVDLRLNPGGLLSEAVAVASLFVEQGTIVTQEDNNGAVRERQNAISSPRVGDIPVVVLVNGGSASASEIVAGALQDYHKAVIVGERSFGKGSVQNVFMVGQKAAYKLTTQYYRLPGRDGQPGRLIHRKPESQTWGIQPDVEVEVLPKQFGEAFQLRQNADVVEFDEGGNLIPRDDRPDPWKLISEGLDPQLETGLLLIQSQVVPASIGRQALAR